MKKYILLTLCLFCTAFLVSCGVAEQDDINEDLVATQVNIILTETAIHVEAEPDPKASPTMAPSPTELETEQEPTLTPTELPTETPTSTPDLEDPAQLLGSPAWTYDFNGDTSPWDFESTQALYRTENGYLNMTARANPNWHNWWLSSPKLQNAYVEAIIQMSTCSGADRFGLAVRANSDAQQFYLMNVTCDGRWGFFRMDEDVNINTILGYQSTETLTPGLTDPHRIGIWMKGSDFTLFLNGIEVGQASDTTLSDAGYTGFLIAFANTPNFTVRVDTLQYWNVP